MNETKPLTTEQIETMRQLVAEHDHGKQANVFDLSKPQVHPYVFQRFPMLVYDHKKSHASRAVVRRTALGEETSYFEGAYYATKKVENEAELKQALAAGWVKEAPDFNSAKDEDATASYEPETLESDEGLDGEGEPEAEAEAVEAPETHAVTAGRKRK